MTQPVIFQFGDAELCHQPIIVIAVRAWFGRMFIVGQHIEIIIDYLFQWLNHGKQLFVHGYFTTGVLGFGCIDDDLRMFSAAFDDIDTLDCAAYRYSSIRHIDVVPL